MREDDGADPRLNIHTECCGRSQVRLVGLPEESQQWLTSLHEQAIRLHERMRVRLNGITSHGKHTTHLMDMDVHAIVHAWRGVSWHRAAR